MKRTLLLIPIVLLLVMAAVQTAMAQGFRVYNSDGTVLQFSLRTDSIVFYDGIGSDQDFGPFTPVNQLIVGTWCKSKAETITFNEDGTTDYMEGATYEFMPYQGSLVIFNSSGVPVQVLRVPRLTADMLLLATGASPTSFDIYTRTLPVQLVTSITLSETYLNLLVDDTKRIGAMVLPENASNPVLSWESSDEAVAQVISNGLVVGISEGFCKISCSSTDGSGVSAECLVRVGSVSGTTNGHEWVELGLPSGTLWATCNVGADNPEEYGDYFAWGETQPKDDFNWSTYKYCTGYFDALTKYCSNFGNNGFKDYLTELLPEDDAATANWGNDWQMPSCDQIAELFDSSYTTTTWTTKDGVNGRLITSNRNGNSIFLPAAGYRYGTSLDDAGSRGYYWSRSLDPNYNSYAYRLYFNSDGIDIYGNARSLGRSVRPVRKQ